MTARPINPGAEMHLGVRRAVPFIGAVTLRDYCGTDASISRPPGPATAARTPPAALTPTRA